MSRTSKLGMLGTVVVLLIGLGVLLSVPAESTVPVEEPVKAERPVVAEPARSCAMPESPRKVQVPLASAPSGAPLPPEPKWAGQGSMPTESPRQVQELRPMSVPYARFADQLDAFFPYMHDAPPSPAHALEYHQYADEMMAQLHLGGNRDNLEMARLMLFDRLEAPTRKLETQEQMVRRFLSGAFSKEAPAAEVLRFVQQGGGNAGPPMRERSWDIGDKRLTVSVPEVYGMVVLTVTARG
ncbi:hypothetical protein [Hyalangium versicolor]|uniref:hypothetical protein n=1 Tax=Hyalangium versicolor TaxID=2861190 RepID=UPI001CCB9BB2|nr:hypothetical protein [Hyalangium versicolor]